MADYIVFNSLDETAQYAGTPDFDRCGYCGYQHAHSWLMHQQSVSMNETARSKDPLGWKLSPFERGVKRGIALAAELFAQDTFGRGKVVQFGGYANDEVILAMAGKLPKNPLHISCRSCYGPSSNHRPEKDCTLCKGRGWEFVSADELKEGNGG